ncbi:MAG: reductive dehalogenase [Chloroflexi bacterium]|nr:reductive dehalogenase [Chloroflexota bacterium]
MSLARWIRRLYVDTIPDGTPYRVDENVYKRFDQRNNLTVGRPNWDPSIQNFTQRAKDTRIKHIRAHRSGYDLCDYSLFFSTGVVASKQGTSINQSNRGLTSWAALGSAAEEDLVAPDMPAELSVWKGSPEPAAILIKRVARYLGADLVGIAPLDKRWIFSHAYWKDETHKEIVFGDIDHPQETEQQLIIPENMKWVIVMGTKMEYDEIGFTPSPTGCAETQLIYSRMATQVAGMAEFLRGIGYNAIPSLNDLGTSIPMAIDAGFGEQGRNGKLITPEFGPNVRLCKVITDLPLARDYPIRFGVKEFCTVCKKCAECCPSKAIPFGEPSWNGVSISNNPGVFTWQLNNDTCRKYWALGPGTNCTICIRVCPFTKNAGFLHEIVKLFISRIPALNPILRRADDLLGYGKEKDPGRFW